MASPTLSVVMPNYNHGHLIARALSAIAAQEYTPIEIVVVDDCSTDDSVALLTDLAGKNPLIHLLVNSRNLGACQAANVGVEQCRGDFVYIPAADDYVAPGFFAKAMTLAAQHPEVGIVFAKMAVEDAGKPVGCHEVSEWNQPVHASPRQFLQEYLDRELATHSLCPATIYRRQPFLDAGGYRPELGHWGDTFVARALGLRYGACYLPEIAMTWCVSPQSYSRSFSLEERLAIVERAVALMRSAEFRPWFPEDYVRRWEQGYRRELYRDTVKRQWRGLGWLSRQGTLPASFAHLLMAPLVRYTGWKWERKRRQTA